MDNKLNIATSFTGGGVSVSVIIPVYNTAPYFADCLDSVLAQTFTDFEVICVNDGSSDHSQEILEKYAMRDRRIRIITQKNQGVCAARNRAIAAAGGKYTQYELFCGKSRWQR